MLSPQDREQDKDARFHLLLNIMLGVLGEAIREDGK